VDVFSKNPEIIIIGNKTDLPSKRVVSYEEAKKDGDFLGITVLETSAKNNLNINNLFLKITENIYKYNINNKILEGMEKSVLLNEEESTVCCHLI